jgi:D-glycero-D-manno-heptose 1,7-bisphosphate phosphatase
MTFRHVILDRDGVLNHEAPAGGYITRPEDFSWLPGALEALRMLREAGLYLSVATNQSGVGRGLMSLAQLEAVHERMTSEAARQGAALDAVLFCPHGPDDGCDCRKPAPGMVTKAMRDLGFRPNEVVLIGDSDADMGAAEAAGIQGVRVAVAGRSAPVGAARDFLEAARRACALLSERGG